MQLLVSRLFIFIIFLQSATAQQIKSRINYKGLPVLQSNKDTLFISVGEYNSNGWIISPQTPSDSLRFGSLSPLEAKFISDLDSISFLVGPGEARHFYIR